MSNTTYELNNAEYKAYHYNPSLAAAVIFIAVFGLMTLVHLYQLIRHKTWYFIPVVIGGLFETIGYVGRALNSHETPNWSLTPFIIQTLLILIAPVIIAASVYMVLSRIIRLVGGEHLSPIRRVLITKLFVLGDFIAFTTQSTGGSILSNNGSSNKSSGSSADNKTVGRYIILGGLFLQIIFFGCFICLAGLMHHRLNKSPTDKSSSPVIPWRKHMVVLYLASALIMIRSIFRVAEYAQGDDGYLLRHEYFLYVFDAALMASVLIMYNVVHPNEIKKLYHGLGSEAPQPDASWDMQALRIREADRERDVHLQGGQV